jgi:DNA-binding NarL/FixJ family response regulator
MTRVSIIDDHPVFRQGLVHAVEAADALEVISATGFVEEFAATAPDVDVVILDLGLPGMSGPDAVGHLSSGGARVLVVSAAATQRDVVDAIGAGACGYLTKGAEPSEITHAVEVVASGDTYVSPTLAAYLLRANRGEQSSPHALTEREREILGLVASGERDADIAEQLFISIRTVRSHLDRIRDKTGRRRRADLTRLAIEEGIGEHQHPDPHEQ